MERKVTIAIDGGGMSSFKFDIGSITRLHFGIGNNAPILIQKAICNELVAGKCTHNWFNIDIDEGNGTEFICVTITNGDNVSCNFIPDGLNSYHIEPNKTVVLKYSRDKTGTYFSESKTHG